MVAPFDYTSAFGQQGPFGSLSQGLQLGAQLAQADQQTALREAQTAKLQQEMAANQAKAAQQQRLGEAYASLVDKVRAGTWQPADFQNVALLAPKEQSEAAIKFFDTLSKERQAQALSSTTQAMAALGSKNPQIGVDFLNTRAEAFRRQGDEAQAKFLETQAKMAEIDPAPVIATLGETLYGLPGGKDAVEALAKMGEARRAQIRFPIEMTEATAKANSAAVASRYAESNAVLDLQKKGWDITKLQNDIEVSKQNVKIAAIQAQLAREGNDLKRRELEARLQEAQEKRDTTIREKAADLESARFNVDNMLNTATRIINTPMSVIGAAAGPISARIITTSQDTADFEELVTTLGSQSFLAQIPNIKGMGGLSNAEGDKLQAALQNFSLRQSPERLVENVKEAKRLLTKARKNMTARAGLPESAPDVPAGPGPAIPQVGTPQSIGGAMPGVPGPEMPAGFRVIRR